MSPVLYSPPTLPTRSSMTSTFVLALLLLVVPCAARNHLELDVEIAKHAAKTSAVSGIGEECDKSVTTISEGYATWIKGARECVVACSPLSMEFNSPCEFTCAASIVQWACLKSLTKTGPAVTKGPAVDDSKVSAKGKKKLAAIAAFEAKALPVLRHPANTAVKLKPLFATLDELYSVTSMDNMICRFDCKAPRLSQTDTHTSEGTTHGESVRQTDTRVTHTCTASGVSGTHVHMHLQSPARLYSGSW